MSGIDTRAAVCQAIEDAISALAAYCCEDDDVITDAVLIVGAQTIDEDGDRLGRVIVFPRHGAQPPYISIGLVESARRMIDKAEDDR